MKERERKKRETETERGRARERKIYLTYFPLSDGVHGVVVRFHHD